MRYSRIAAACAAVVIGVAGFGSTVSTADAKASVWKNCTSVHKTYAHGVGKKHAHDHTSSGRNPVTNFKHSTKLFKAAMNHNKGLDRDGDKVACETH